MTAILEVSRLSRAFGAVQALNSLDLYVNDGEILAIIGPNGCGKTTFFNCVSGRVVPSGGQVRWLGNEITGMPMHKVARRGLVRTFQETRIFRSGTVLSNLEMAVAVAGAERKKGREDGLPLGVAELLSFCGLEAVAHMHASAMPFGYARRLGVAIALTARPRLLLLDEPAAGLNDAESADFADFLKRLHERGTTLAIVDHDMDFLLPLVHRVVVLAAGQNLTEGTADEIRRDPAVIEVYLGKLGAKAGGSIPDKPRNG